MKSIKLILFLVLLNQLTFASTENHLAGARSAAMGTASVASSDLWASFNNQAALARLKGTHLGVFYENRFQISDLSTKAIALYLPTKLGGFNLNYSQFGSDLYKECKIGLGYSKTLSKRLWAGVQINQLQIKMNQTYGDQTRYNFEIGLLAELFSDFYLGFHIFNPTQEKFETFYFDEALPTIARLGFSWNLSKETSINAEVQKDFDYDIRLKMGLEYQVLNDLFIRLGALNHPNQINLGLGYKYKLIHMNLAYSKHQNLGYTPSLDLNISF
ncbi:hypothetical protein EO244_02565 [Ancylomarina salipaludis]|uniref:PorV/PorQ family protein n=1 Tax=Ancylomarina salipaludis TaxID=2501299 RepID=A0A4Q1JP00_9BACT|nr:hypothetical protein [Ancylomarina salipaludis]RXQ96532.1 hypothetical protein EO244_02565 [Ancylomarina salipaludis]